MKQSEWLTRCNHHNTVNVRMLVRRYDHVVRVIEDALPTFQRIERTPQLSRVELAPLLVAGQASAGFGWSDSPLGHSSFCYNPRTSRTTS